MQAPPSTATATATAVDGGAPSAPSGAQLPPRSPQPSTSRATEASSSSAPQACDTPVEPQPGPSTSAADFDLEVFDSGSSCSLEDCYGAEKKTGKGKQARVKAASTASPARKGDKQMAKKVEDEPKVASGELPPISACPSETEEDETTEGAPSPAQRSTKEDDLDLDDDDDESCENYSFPSASVAATSTSSAAALPPATVENPRETVDRWKCEPVPSSSKGNNPMEEEEIAASSSADNASTSTTQPKSDAGPSSNHPEPIAGPSRILDPSSAGPSRSSADASENIDEIVQDHDTFGIDENEDDSLLDSLADTAATALAELSNEGIYHALGSAHQSVLLQQQVAATVPTKRKSEPNLNEDENGPGSKKPYILSSPPSTANVAAGATAEPPCGQSQVKPAGIQDAAGPAEPRSEGSSACLVIDDEEHEEEEEEEEKETSPTEPQHQLSSSSSSTVSAPSPDVLAWISQFNTFAPGQKLSALDSLISQCQPTHVRHMMEVIEPQFQRDFISLLPKELALYVLCFLSPRDLLRAAQTCNYWRILCEDNLLWREKCREAGLEDLEEMRKLRLRRASSGFLYSSYKSGYMRNHNIEMNWRVRPIRQPKVLKGHDDHVITCLQFSEGRIVSGSDDNTLKVWSATTGKCLRTLHGHTGGVWSSQMEGNTIVSGSTDRSLKVWDATSGACVHTLYGHTSTVRCMHLHENRVVSGSRDATLRMWDIESGTCLHVLVGHVAAVRCVQYDGRLVVSGAYDYMVKVWNPEKEECLHTLSGHTNRVYSLQFDGIHVVSGSLDTSIRVWDVESGACKHALMGHQSLTSGMELRNNILVSGNADSTVKVWDITTGQCLQTLSGNNKHQSAVTCLQFNSKFVITSSDDGTVKLWDVKTGEFIRDLVALESGGSGGVVWRIRSNATKLVCAVGSRNGTEETKLMVLDFDASDGRASSSVCEAVM